MIEPVDRPTLSWEPRRSCVQCKYESSVVITCLGVLTCSGESRGYYNCDIPNNYHV